VWLFLAACELTGAPVGTPSSCIVANEGPVPADFTTLAGYSANDVSAWLVRTAQAELTYTATGATSFVEVAANTSGDPIFRDYSTADGSASLCSDALALPGTLSIQSRDGAFSESIQGEFATTSADLANFSVQLETWSGTYDLESGDGIQIDARFTPGDTTGTISSWSADGSTAAIASWVDEL
jgi:hypothetical protein